MAYVIKYMYHGPWVSVVQLNWKLDSCMRVLVELLKKLHKILVSCNWVMYIYHVSVYNASNSTHVVCPLMPHHHWILLMHSAWSIRIQVVQIMENVHIWYTQLLILGLGAVNTMYVHIVCAQNSFYYFRVVVTHATFGLLGVAAFQESNNLPRTYWIRSKTVIVAKGADCLSRLHTKHCYVAIVHWMDLIHYSFASLILFHVPYTLDCFRTIYRL